MRQGWNRQGTQAEQEQQALACCRFQRKAVSFHLTALLSQTSFAGDAKTGWSDRYTKWLCYHSELLQQAAEMDQCEVQLGLAPGKK